MSNIERPNEQKVAIIIGGGPAGLTAAYELLDHTDVLPIIFEADPTYVGGISKTVEYKGNRIDIGGHRFFSKSDKVMDWWLKILPLGEEMAQKDINYQGQHHSVEQPTVAAPQNSDDVMLVRKRVSRIYYNKTFFPYPLQLNFETLSKLGFVKTIKIGLTYIHRVFFPIKNETSLEDFFINRFGDELYRTFFKSYTEKVWGKPCSELSADWGAQRVKGLSIAKAIQDVLLRPFKSKDIKQKDRETSLIEQFLYPKFGPGHLWEVVAKKIVAKGGQIQMGVRVVGVNLNEGAIVSVDTLSANGTRQTIAADYLFSTTSIKELSSAFAAQMPKAVSSLAQNLEFRSFITVGVLIPKEEVKKKLPVLEDTWMYIHEPRVQVGRIQVFNNWSPYLVHDETYYWLGLEYFCDEGDAMWRMSDAELTALATQELQQIGFISSASLVLDATVLREAKTYPVYAGVYEQFDVIRDYLNSVPNIFPVGRNGMHRYNNQDHSMLTAMAAVQLIKNGSSDKTALWEINLEREYHEEKK